MGFDLFGLVIWLYETHYFFLRDLVLVAFGTLTLGSLACLIYVFLEQYFPAIFLPRAKATYSAQAGSLASILIVVGLFATAAILIWWSTQDLASPPWLPIVISLAVFDVGAIMFLTSEKQEKLADGSSP